MCRRYDEGCSLHFDLDSGTPPLRQTGPLSGSGERGRALGFEFTHERNHVLAKMLDLFLEVQEAEQDQARSGILQREDALRNLVRRADEVRPKAVVVLNEIVKRRLRP